MEQKILAKTKYNHGEALVLDHTPELEYEKIGSSVIGSDGIFYKFYYYERPTKAFQAFGGREFEILLKSGEIIKCNGQWWDGIGPNVTDEIKESIIRCTAASLDDIINCYVYYGYYADKNKLQTMHDAYNGPLFDYHELDRLMR